MDVWKYLIHVDMPVIIADCRLKTLILLVVSRGWFSLSYWRSPSPAALEDPADSDSDWVCVSMYM